MYSRQMAQPMSAAAAEEADRATCSCLAAPGPPPSGASNTLRSADQGRRRPAPRTRRFSRSRFPITFPAFQSAGGGGGGPAALRSAWLGQLLPRRAPAGSGQRPGQLRSRPAARASSPLHPLRPTRQYGTEPALTPDRRAPAEPPR
jgi:hypothetical protein